MDELSIEIGKRIAEKRKANGITREAVTRELCISPSLICRWERGDFSPGAFYLCKLADFFGCSVDELVGRNSDGCS